MDEADDWQPEGDPYHNSDASSDDPDYTPIIKNKTQSRISNFFAPSTSSQKLPSDANLSYIPTTAASTSKSTKINKKSGLDEPSVLFRDYFHVVNSEGHNLETECQLCHPKKRIIKGSTEATTNFIKHLRRMHPDSLKNYEDMKKEKFSKRSKSNDSVDAKRNKHATNKIHLHGRNKLPTNQATFDDRVIQFIINTMSPLSIIEHESFINLFKDMNVKVITRKTAVKRITVMFQTHINNLTSKLEDQTFLCTTSDVWSGRRRSFIGVTCHWIRDDYVRESVALACERFSGVHNYKNIAEKLQLINAKYKINEQKIVATVTDNGSNFVKAFRVFSTENKIPNLSQANDDHRQIDQSDDEDDNGDIQFHQIDETSDEIEDAVILPKHKRCASHTLNLIATTDLRKVIDGNSQTRTRNMHSLAKCNQLWKKAGQPKSSEVIKMILGHTLSSPGMTRWNSLYDSIRQILAEKSKLQDLTSRLEIKHFTENDFNYLEDYCTVMGPLAATLDLLQGESNMFYGVLLPSLVSLRNKLEKLEKHKFKSCGSVLLKTVQESLRKRFSDILTFKDHDAVVASVVHPQFKFRWYSENVLHDISIEEIKQKVLGECAAFFCGNAGAGDESMTTCETDNFFDFNEEHPITSSSSSLTTRCLSKTELELLHYLDDPRRNLSMLDSYPLVKKVFQKFNTCLPSSASVERLFSFATFMDVPRRHGLTDENFERLIILRANKVN